MVIPHLDGRQLLVSILPGEFIKPDEMKMIPDEGMPVYRRSHENGHLFIRFSVKFPVPHSIPEEKLRQLEAILPGRTSIPSLEGKEVDEYVLQNVDPSQQAGGRNGGGGATSMDYEDEDDHHGGPQVQCAQQ